MLVDLDSDEVYLGELNPRISGASAITNVTAGAYADVPLFLFHLLEFMGVDFELDVDEVNDRWTELASSDLWSQMIIKEIAPGVEHIDTAPPTGAYRVDGSGALVFARTALDWHQLQNESECFFLRVYGVGDYRWKGADLGVLVTKGRLQTEGRSANAAEHPDHPGQAPDRLGPGALLRHAVRRRRRARRQGSRVDVTTCPGQASSPAPGHRQGSSEGMAAVSPAGLQVTNENWQTPPQLAWAFQHIADLFPVAGISRGAGPVAPLTPTRRAGARRPARSRRSS